jgi:hypothetical protein
MPRLSVYVDDEVRRELDDLEAAGISFNVSQACGEGLRRALGDVATSPELVAKRLLAREEAAAVEAAEAGRRDGERWARCLALPNELRRLQDLGRKRPGVKADPIFDGPAWPAADARLAAWIMTGPADPLKAAQFWTEVEALDRARPRARVTRTDAYVREFIAGAVAVWEAAGPLVDKGRFHKREGL